MISRRTLVAALAVAIAIGAAATAQEIPAVGDAPDELPVFGRPYADADFETLSVFRLGNAVFRQEWAAAGEGSAHFDGLGPLYNARSCEGCHIRDGRGRPPAPGGGDYDETSMIVKLARPGDGAPDPVYGRQLQDFAIDGHVPEGQVRIDYDEADFAFPDGEVVRLRRPRFRLVSLSRGPLEPETRLSARIAPPMIGLGLIARVPESEILAGTDPDDSDGDGISGRVNRVPGVASGGEAIGRFGWKAGQATIEDQVSLAFSNDMGIATPFRPEPFGDCTAEEAACRAAADGGTPEFEDLEAHSVLVEWLVRYSENLAVPEPRDAGGGGAALFASVGCAGCHRPSFDAPPDPDQPHLGGREVRAYTDLLVHDMGEALADAFGEGGATGAEWRTAPLWGVGLAGQANGNAVFLHDGRARSIVEAILWHGGEAAAVRDAFAALARPDRDRLIAFVASL